MTSSDYSKNELLYFEHCGQHFYVGKVYVEKEEDHVDFIYQQVKKRCNNIYYARDNDCFLYKVTENSKLRKYFPKLYWCSVDISISPLLKQNKTLFDYTVADKGSFDTYIHHCDKIFGKIDNYIDIKFPEAVYPIRVSIYEYRVRNTIQIWAQDFDNHQWYLLWDRSHDKSQYDLTYNKPRLFSPPLMMYNFKTKMLRLQSLCCSNINAVMLIGTSKMILPRNPKENLTNLLNSINRMYNYQDDIYNLTNNKENAHLDVVRLQENLFEYCIISKSNLSSDESSRFNLSELPEEIILKILKNLDLPSLCCMNQVNTFFKEITKDAQLYKRLNVRNMYYPNSSKDTADIFHYFTPRCKYIQQLDLTSTRFYFNDFISFLKNCGKHLTHLRLNYCFGVNNLVLLNISRKCKNLKELTLADCKEINESFLCLEKLNNLEHLDLSYTHIQAQVLCKILKSNKQMRVLYLKHFETNIDPIAIELKNSCPNLEILNLKFVYNITLQSINALPDCKNLRKVNLHGCNVGFYDSDVGDDNFYRLLSSCQRLEEIHLPSSINFNDRYLELLSQCQNLEQLYLHEPSLTFDRCSLILERCSKVQRFYIISLLNRCSSYEKPLRKKYPHVFIDFTTFFYNE